MSKLSIIIAALNEDDLQNTVDSIRNTAGSDPEIVIVDDCSSMPVQCEGAIVVHNAMRCGVGPSRTIGALEASGDYLLIIDGHHRFLPGWYEQAMRRIDARPKTIHCATCLAIDSANPDPAKPKGEYYGATLNVYGPDRVKPGSMQVMESVWGPRVEDDEEIPSIMGACYFVPREFFLKINPLAHLKSWGCDETMLALKAYLHGGDCRYMANVKIAHRFLVNGERQRFNVPVGHTVYNKQFMIRTLVGPESLRNFLLCKLKEVSPPNDHIAADAMVRENWYLIAQERRKNMELKPFVWYARHFGLNLPHYSD